MPVALYLRVSTEEQRERQSIATQREFAERYCALHQLTISAVYADDGVSGTIPLPSRPAGCRIITDARVRRFDQLLLYKLDRLGRETRLTLEAVAELERWGVRVRSLTEEFDTATASGRLMLTMLSGFAAHEREVIRERSLAGSQRVAASGAWMGGPVPYGYRLDGSHRRAGLMLSEEPLATIDLSEAKVIRTIFRMAGSEHLSCPRIADHLNSLGVPCASARNAVNPPLGKPAKHWSAGRIRNLLISATYKGQHIYGKRSSNPQRAVIQRNVPAIVGEALWQQAQETLRRNFRFGPRHCKHRYLLRGLVKCGICGLAYIGMTVRSRSGRQDAYYRCNGKHDTRGVYGELGRRCPAKDIQGDWLERVVWDEIADMLRQPERAVKRLRRQLEKQRHQQEGTRARLAGVQQELEQKSAERDRVVGLYRKGRLGEDAVERQMREIEEEEAGLRAEMGELTRRLEGVDTEAAQLAAAANVLERLGARWQPPLSAESRREVVECLVEQVRVDTRDSGGQRLASVTVFYRLAETRPNITPRKNKRGSSGWSPGWPQTSDRSPRFELRMRYPAGHANKARSIAAHRIGLGPPQGE